MCVCVRVCVLCTSFLVRGGSRRIDFHHVSSARDSYRESYLSEVGEKREGGWGRVRKGKGSEYRSLN